MTLLTHHYYNAIYSDQICCSVNLVLYLGPFDCKFLQSDRKFNATRIT